MISLVIPVYSEAGSLGELHTEIAAVADRLGDTLEILFVDDGSSDRSWAEIVRLAESDSRVRGIRFRRNFGKAAALSAGFHAARGERVVTLDADLQDVPAEIPRLLARLEEDCDLVSGWKQVRYDPWHKVLPSRVFNWLVSRMTGVRLHDHNCGMKAYRRQVVREIRLYGELHRFVPVLAAARGFRVGELAVQHRPRRHGQSKYGVERLFKGFLDLLTVKFLTGFGYRPLHLLGGIGLASFVMGLFALTYLAVEWVITRTVPGLTPTHLHERAALFYSLALLLVGGQFISVGFLGELIISHLGRDDDVYAIAEETTISQDQV